uniref:aldehyde oxygenase (deformylating) n=1 Tax=Anthurium amnicola TaxID=1678845 RepID=A0A1D1XVU8_9ARAE
MDIVLSYADEYLFDDLYAHIFPRFVHPYFPSLSTISFLSRDDVYRQYTTLFIITIAFITTFYFSLSGVSYYLVFDHDLMKHPKFLKNQIRKEISLAVGGFPITTAVTIPWFIGEVKGYSRLYDDVEKYGWWYLIASVPMFLLFTDFCIYWIHRWLHHPLIYKHLHKPHHRWIVPTPFSSHAFHPLDGYLQSVPYHLFVFLFPLQKYMYLGLFVFVNVWTILIHDGAYVTAHPLINGAAHHTLHHLYFNYNYGQYFTLWDRVGGTHRLPGDEQYKLKKNNIIWEKQAREVDGFDENGKEKVKTN